MWDGKNKAVTFSYDDGVTQDKRLIEIFDRYGLKCTFNLNSGLLGRPGTLIRNGVEINHIKNNSDEVRDIYINHEVAVHTVTHPMLPELSEEEIVSQVEEDRLALESLVGYPVRIMAYPGGGVNNDDRVAQIIKDKTKVLFARTTDSTGSFDMQDNLYRFKPTVYHHMNWDNMFRLLDEFLALKADEPKVFYIWGHAYEFDIDNSWDKMEEFCSRISGRQDIFYGTNSQVFLGDKQ